MKVTCNKIRIISTNVSCNVLSGLLLFACFSMSHTILVLASSSLALLRILIVREYHSLDNREPRGFLGIIHRQADIREHFGLREKTK